MSAANPIDFPEIWHSIVITGEPSPGVAKVSGHARLYDWDKKKAKGKQGASTTLTGDDPPDFDVTLKLWTSDHFKAWDKFRPRLEYNPGKSPVKAVDIYHPSLVDLKIKSVVTKSIGGIEIDETGLGTVKLKFMEYYPPKKGNATKTPDGSKDKDKKPSGDPPPTVLSAKQQEIARLTALAGAP